MNSRRKGATFERMIANKIASCTALDVHRGLGQARSGKVAPDVDLPGYWIECKHRNTVDPDGALDQARRDAVGTTRIPVAIWRATGARGIYVTTYVSSAFDFAGLTLAGLAVTVPFDDWLEAIAARFNPRIPSPNPTGGSPL